MMRLYFSFFMACLLFSLNRFFAFFGRFPPDALIDFAVESSAEWFGELSGDAVNEFSDAVFSGDCDGDFCGDFFAGELAEGAGEAERAGEAEEAGEAKGAGEADDFLGEFSGDELACGSGELSRDASDAFSDFLTAFFGTFVTVFAVDFAVDFALRGRAIFQIAIK